MQASAVLPTSDVDRSSRACLQPLGWECKGLLKIRPWGMFLNNLFYVRISSKALRGIQIQYFRKHILYSYVVSIVEGGLQNATLCTWWLHLGAVSEKQCWHSDDSCEIVDKLQELKWHNHWPLRHHSLHLCRVWSIGRLAHTSKMLRKIQHRIPNIPTKMRVVKLKGHCQPAKYKASHNVIL